MHNEIELRLKAGGNGCFFAMSHLFKLKLLSRKSIDELYTTYIRLVLSYAMLYLGHITARYMIID